MDKNMKKENIINRLSENEKILLLDIQNMLDSLPEKGEKLKLKITEKYIKKIEVCSNIC